MGQMLKERGGTSGYALDNSHSLAQCMAARLWVRRRRGHGKGLDSMQSITIESRMQAVRCAFVLKLAAKGKIDWFRKRAGSVS